MGSMSEKSSELQREIDEIRNRMSVNRADIDALQARADIDRALIAELSADGIINRAYSAHLEEALRTSRTIGAAVGILMATRKLTEEAAFAILVRASQHTNRKVRILAEEVVRTGDLDELLDA